jgi:ABC-2 type transport system ATP-binding protein
MLTGRARPTGGRAHVCGFDIVHEREPMKPLINLVFEEQNLYERLTGRENLQLFAELYDVPRARVDQLLDAVRLTGAARRKVKTYSSGMKQRLLVARALLNRPRVSSSTNRRAASIRLRPARSARWSASRRGRAQPSSSRRTTWRRPMSSATASPSSQPAGSLPSTRARELKLRYGERTALVLLDTREEIRLGLDDPADAARLEAWRAAGRIRTVHSQEGTLEDVFVNLAGRPL